jgi:predicted metal-dependent phosphoesterase TrpH
MKIDLHVHASERSDCARATEESQIRAAIAAGLDGMAFTDHHLQMPLARMDALREKFSPFKIYTGIEITADHEDWLVLGLRDPRLESDRWRYPALRQFVREQGGFIALAHPFRYTGRIEVDIDACPPDGVEVRSVNTPPAREQEIREIALRLNLRLLQNSDAHVNAPLGQFYNDLPDSLDGDLDLVRILKRL